MDSDRGCLQSGAVRFSAVDGRRVENGWQSGFHPNTALRSHERSRRTNWLSRAADILQAQRAGEKKGLKFLIAWLVVTPGEMGRVGIVVPKLNQSAVARNQLKRRLRELTRGLLTEHLRGVRIVMRSRVEAYTATFAELQADVLAVAHWVQERAMPD